MIENNGITPNLNTQVQITENDVQEVMNEHPLFKVMVENKSLRRIIQGQSEYIKKFQDPKNQIVPPFLEDIPKSEVKKNG
jgi:hypothetical protein